VSRFAAASKGEGGSISKLNRVYQLTGFADPVYCEAMLTGQCVLGLPSRVDCLHCLDRLDCLALVA
jgi:hypothetical protein